MQKEPTETTAPTPGQGGLGSTPEDIDFKNNIPPNQPPEESQDNLNTANNMNPKLPGEIQGKTGKKKSSLTYKYYRKGMCNYSSAGTNCHFSHPGQCDKFLRDGNRADGCKQGRKCKFFHPRICKYSLSNRTCYNLSCNFFHLKGTIGGTNPRQ